jgi:N-methylhydantoinase A
LGRREVYFQPDSPEEIPFFRGEALQPGNRITGPAIIVRADTTILLGKGDQGEVDVYLNLMIQVASES